MTWFSPPPQETGPSVARAVAAVHRARLRIVAPLLALIAAYSIVVDFVLLTRAAGVDQLLLYLRLDVTFLVINLVAFGVTCWKPQGIEVGWMILYTALVLVWAALVGAVELQRTGNYTTMLLALLTTGTVALFSPLVFVGLVAGCLGLYLVFLAAVPGFGLPDLETNASLFGLAVLSFGISRILYKATVGNILSNAEVQEARLNLIRQEKLASLGVLAAGIAHEINNPLSFIKSNLAVLERNQTELTGDPGVLAENQQIFVETREGFGRISDVVRALGTFTRGAQDTSPEAYDLNEGVRTTVALTRHETKGGMVVDLLLGEAPPVPARGSEVNQVILNLLINAFQAVRTLENPDQGHVGIRTSSSPSAVILEIWNNGPPIPAELKDRIFEPFFSTKEPGASMGLGLSLAWEIIVVRHGGTLESTQDGGGSVTFRMTLPR